MGKLPTPYRDLIAGLVKQRRFLQRTMRSYKNSSVVESTLMKCESLLQRLPQEQTVVDFIRRNRDELLYLVPAKNDKRKQLILEI